MATSALKVVLLLAIVAAAAACSVPPAGCAAPKCNALSTSLKQYSTPMGFWYGIWNNVTYPDKTASDMKRGGPWINYEVFMEIGKLVGTTAATTLAQCCLDCAAKDGCYQYHFFDKVTLSQTVSKMGPNFDKNIKCYLIAGGSAYDDDKVIGTPFSGTHSQQKGYLTTVDASWVGGMCNGNPGVKDDPHFSGALGTKFDFNGEAGKSFCLVSDERLHINVVLGGYEDTSVAATASEGKKALRTWIQEVGITWRAADGATHTAHLVARKGKDQARGTAGFLSALTVDGIAAVVPEAVGEAVTGAGDFSLSLDKSAKKGPYDVDTFTLKLGGLADMSVRMRVAHPMLQTAEEAYAHFNLHFNDLKASPKVHGVLGQTFRPTIVQAQRALQYSLLSKLLRGPIVADGASGSGFLDGKTDDYVSSSALATDCSFSAFST